MLLWYVLAEANAIGNSEITAGTTLKVPDVGQHKNDATTFKPYNPAETIGNTSPTLPYIQAPQAGCNALVAIVMIVVVIVVCAYAPYLAEAIGPIFGSLAVTEAVIVGATVLGAHASTTATLSAMGLHSFNWRASVQEGVIAGVSYGLTQGISQALEASTAELAQQFAKAPSLLGAGKLAASAVGGALANYAASEIAGVRDNSFNWKNIAASAVSSVATAAITNQFTWSDRFTRAFASAAVGGIVSHHSRKAFGLEGDINYLQIALDAFGNALGSSIAGEMTPPSNADIGAVEQSAEGSHITSSRWIRTFDDNIDADTPEMSVITADDYIDPNTPMIAEMMVYGRKDGSSDLYVWDPVLKQWGTNVTINVPTGNFSVGAPVSRFNPTRQGVSPLPRGAQNNGGVYGGEIEQ